jgi:hypothetical protein
MSTEKLDMAFPYQESGWGDAIGYPQVDWSVQAWCQARDEALRTEPESNLGK